MKKGKMKSPHTGEEFKAADVLPRIQEILREENYNTFETNTTSDTIIESLNKMRLMIDGLNHIAEYGELEPADASAIGLEFGRLKEAIEVREETHSKVWDLALHGKEENSQPKPKKPL